MWLRLLPAVLCPSVHAARAEAARGVAHPAPPRGESAAPKCRKPVGLSGGLIFPLDLRTFGHPPEFPAAPPVWAGGGAVGTDRTVGLRLLFSTLEMQSIREAAENEVTGPHHRGRPPPPGDTVEAGFHLF